MQHPAGHRDVDPVVLMTGRGLGPAGTLFGSTFSRAKYALARFRISIHLLDPHLPPQPASSARLQVEVLNRRRWGIRVELANAIFEYIKCIDNWRRRHSALNWTSP